MPRCSRAWPVCTWVDVPYKGSGPALNDLISGQVDLMFDQLPSSLAQVQGGRLKAVAVTSRKRTSVAPDIPTIAESGLPAFEATSWWGVFAPPKTPADIVAKLNAAIHQALVDPQLLVTFKQMGLEAWQSTPEELAKLLVDERAQVAEGHRRQQHRSELMPGSGMRRAWWAVCFVLALSSQALAQDYPSHPIKMIVPTSAGGIKTQ